MLCGIKTNIPVEELKDKNSYPELRLEPVSLALRASAVTTKLSRKNADP